MMAGSPAPRPGTSHPVAVRDPKPMLHRTLAQWGGAGDLWVFAYASLIWRPDFDVVEQRKAKVHGWHRALKMWSRINRGTIECPGLVFALLSGGSCQGAVLKVERRHGEEVMHKLWDREMSTGVYDPRWLRCNTRQGPVHALAFTLSRHSPNFTGELSAEQYRDIFSKSCGKYGSTLEYADLTLRCLHTHGIHDPALKKLLLHAQCGEGHAGFDRPTVGKVGGPGQNAADRPGANGH